MNMLDTLISEVDNALRTLFPPPQRASNRSSPAMQVDDTHLSTEKKTCSGSHAGKPLG